MTNSTVRVLQVTDCHILPEEGREAYGTDTYRSLQSVRDAALAFSDPPDLIVATGDLSEDATDESYRRLQGLIHATGLPAYVIPGNHDSLEAIGRSLLSPSIMHVPTLDAGQWRFVFLNSKVDGAAHGYLAESDLSRLKQALDDASGLSVVACLHHSPVRPCPSTGCHLHNDEELLELLRNHTSARLVLAGHAHLESERRIAQTTVLTTPATSSQCAHSQLGDPVDHEDFWASHVFDPSRHGFRMLTLKADGEFETQVHWV